MKVTVHVDRAPDGASWTVAIAGRPDRVLARTPKGYPVPPEAALLPAAFVSAGEPDPSRLDACLARIRSGNPSPPAPALGVAGDMMDFGRYLLALLFGDGWDSILQLNAEPELELELQWGAPDAELARLPWEMMCAGEKFLAACGKPSVSVLRRVPVEGGQPLGAKGEADLRVLFVVGNELSDPSIRAGAEYLGLLRRLRSQWMSLPHRLVLVASRSDVEEVARQYQPTVVHLTCHGDWNTIRLRPGEEATPAERAQGYASLTAKDFMQLLPATPHIVVVNACDSASGRPPQPDATGKSSFGAELARLGVPVVVGMGGSVADHASRLFTLRFYQALLEAGQDGKVSPAAAAAEGRRAALRMSAAPLSSEWIHSRVLVRSDADPVVTLRGIQLAQQLDTIARSFQTRGPLCDRYDVFREFEKWLYGVRPEGTLFVLQGPDVSAPPVQYGCSHLLQELAAHAAGSGFLPVVADVQSADNVGVPLDEMLRRIALAMEWARRRSGLAGVAMTALADLVRILRARGSAPLHPVLVQRLQLADVDEAETIGAALGADLSALAVDARAAGLRPLLMLDDVHKWAPALGLLVEVLEQRISFSEEPVPIALCCRKWPAQQTADGPVRRLLENPAVRVVAVEKFGADQEGLAYRQYAILRKPPLVANPANTEAAAMFESVLQKYVEGIPSRFRDDKVSYALDVLTMSKLLVSADDDSILQNGRTGGN